MWIAFTGRFPKLKYKLYRSRAIFVNMWNASSKLAEWRSFFQIIWQCIQFTNGIWYEWLCKYQVYNFVLYTFLHFEYCIIYLFRKLAIVSIGYGRKCLHVLYIFINLAFLFFFLCIMAPNQFQNIKIVYMLTYASLLRFLQNIVAVSQIYQYLKLYVPCPKSSQVCHYKDTSLP